MPTQADSAQSTPNEPPNTADRRAGSWWICLLLALVTVAVFSPVTKNGFVNLDDPDYVSLNPAVKGGLTIDGIRWAFTSYHSSNWHPLTWLSHMLDCQLYGLNPSGHHLTSLLIHLINSLLLFGLLIRMTGARWRSALVAALFAWHPLHVESVAWIAERKDVLSGLFFMLTLWAYACYVHALRHNRLPRRAAPPWILYGITLILFSMGLMCKPMLVTVPFLLLLLDWWPLKRYSLPPHQTWRASAALLLPSALEKLPFFALSVACSVTTYLVQNASGAVVSLSNGPFETRLAGALVAYIRYICKTFYPSRLAAFYPYVPFEWSSSTVVGASLILAIASATFSWICFRKHSVPRNRWLLVGWLWFLGMLVPVIGLVQVGRQAMADRYTYLPHIGLFIILAWGGASLVERISSRPPHHRGRSDNEPPPEATPRGVPSSLTRIALGGMALVGVALCAILSHRQVAFWRNDRTLAEHALEATDGNYIAHAILANALIEEEKLQPAIDHCTAALAILPTLPEAHNTLGNIYVKQQQWELAAGSYQEAIKNDPSYVEAYNGLGNVLIQQKRYPEAEAQCREALRRAPHHLLATFNLALALHNQGKLVEAAQSYREVLALAPDLFPPRRSLGNILLVQGRPEEAICHLTAALQIRPTDVDTLVVLGMAFMNGGQTEQAGATFLKATLLQPTNSAANYYLALAHQSQQRRREAVACYRKAVAADPNRPEALNNLAWLLAASPEADLRNGAEAVDLAERACKLTNNQEPLFIGTLAAALAEAGRFAEAVAAAEKARALAAANGLDEIAEKNRQLIEDYRAQKPYREPSPTSAPTAPQL